MKILITNHHLKNKEGSELFTLNLVIELKKKGHQVMVFSPILGEISEEISKMGVFVTNDILSIEKEKIDIIHAQHNTTAILARSIFPNTPMIFMAHGVLPELEQAPSIDLNISKYIAVSEEVAENLKSKNQIPKEKIEIIRNFVDTEKFRSKNNVNEKLRNLLVISNHYVQEVKEIVEKVAKELDLRVEHIGLPENSVTNVENYINNSDMVITLGRGALEAMSCERNLIVYDMHGGDGFVNEENFFEIRKNNFSGRKYKKQYSVESFRNELLKYNPKLGKKLRDIVIKENSREVFVDKLENIYKKCINEKQKNYTFKKYGLYNELSFLEKSVERLDFYINNLWQKEKQITKLYEDKNFRINNFVQEIKEKEIEIEEKNKEIQSKISEIEWMKSSRFWKLKIFYEKFKNPVLDFLRLIKKGFFVLKRDGIIVFLKKLYVLINIFFIESKRKIFFYKIKNKLKKRIVFINHEESATGAPKVLLDLVQKEIERGEFDCWVVSLRIGDNPWNLKQLLRLNDIPGVDYIKKAQYLIEMLQPDVVYANTIASCDFASYFPCRKIASIHEYRSLLPFCNEQKIDMLKTFNTIVVVCEPTEKLFKKWGINAQILPYYLNFNLIKERDFVNPPEDKKYVIGVGFVQLRKGIQRFFEIAKAMPDKQFIWIGGMTKGDIHNNTLFLKGENCLLSDYKERSPIKNITLKLTIPKNVTFTGLINFKKFSEYWIPRAMCLLMLSTDDPFPLVVTEAKLFNLNVVTLKESGDSYKICDEQDLILNFYDKEKIIKYLKKLIPNKTKFNESIRLWLYNNFEKQRNVYVSQLKFAKIPGFFTPIENKINLDFSKKKIAVIVHIHHKELIDEFVKYIKNIPYSLKIFISTREKIKQDVEKKFINVFGSNSITIKVVKDRGRDIGPFVSTFQNFYNNFDYVCKIHTKKSEHLYKNGGDLWRKHLLNNILGNTSIVTTILSHFESNPKLGLIYPENYYKLPNFVVSDQNTEKILMLCKKMNIPFLQGTDQVNFASGTMFWFRPKALQPLFDANISLDDFPEESVKKLDGDLDHAIERLPVIIARSQGFNYEEVLFIKE